MTEQARQLPLYREIAQTLTAEIIDGTIQHQLPSEADLSRRFRTTHTTIRAALRVLYEQRLAHPAHGRGVFVREDREPFCWENLGISGDLPTHLPISMTKDGRGPTDPDPAHHYECWCGDVECPLTLALQHAWTAGRRQGREEER